MKACLQCGAEVPAEDKFCGKCGHAMTRSPSTDATLPGIRELEPVTREPAPSSKPPASRSREATVLGLPPVNRRPSPSNAASAARRPKLSQQTMLGFPRPEELVGQSPSQQPPAADEEEPYVWQDEPEPLPEASPTRQRAFLLGALLIAVAAGWLAYRLLTSHG